MSQMLIRFLVGGGVESAFTIIGDLLKPKSFAGYSVMRRQSRSRLWG
jgi:hypothetical protein